MPEEKKGPMMASIERRRHLNKEAQTCTFTWQTKHKNIYDSKHKNAFEGFKGLAWGERQISGNIPNKW